MAHIIIKGDTDKLKRVMTMIKGNPNYHKEFDDIKLIDSKTTKKVAECIKTWEDDMDFGDMSIHLKCTKGEVFPLQIEAVNGKVAYTVVSLNKDTTKYPPACVFNRKQFDTHFRIGYE